MDADDCPITHFMNHLGGKWKPVILWLLLDQSVMRFSELDKVLTGISQKMLSQQLKDLEALGLIDRKVYPVVPPKVEYRLTEKGESLQALLVEIKRWTTTELMA